MTTQGKSILEKRAFAVKIELGPQSLDFGLGTSWYGSLSRPPSGSKSKIRNSKPKIEVKIESTCFIKGIENGAKRYLSP